MFIHVVNTEKNDIHSRTECKYYSAMTCAGNPYLMQFFAETHKKGEIREMEVDKRTHVVYIESDSGKTIATYKWKLAGKQIIRL
jgi:hypothetical protein